VTTIEEALAEALTPPENYWGSITDLVEQGWAQVWGRHRDSDLLEVSNYEYVLTFLNEKYEVNEDFTVEGSSHWAVGWTDQILVRALRCNCPVYDEHGLTNEPEPCFAYGNVAIDNENIREWWHCINCGEEATVTEVFEDMFNFAERVQDYPLLDEEDFSRREHEEFFDWIEQELHYACGQANLSDEEIDRVTPDEVVTELYNNYSVSNVDDCSFEWVVEAVKEVATKTRS